MYFNDTPAERVRKEYPMKALLNKYGVERRGESYKCPFHDDNTPSAFVGSKGGQTNKLICNACFTRGASSYSVIDVYMHFERCDAKTAINALYGELESGGIIIPQYIERPAEAKIESYTDALECFSEYDKLDRRYKRRIDVFLEERKLYHAKEILTNNGYRIGIKSFISTWGQVYHNKAFDFGTFIQSRAETKDKINKYNAGSVEPKLIKVNSSREYFIVEGVTDALACAEMGHNVIFLNGANNWMKLNLRKSNKYILALDNDDAGLNVKNRLLEKYHNTGVSLEVFHELELNDVKDIGEYYQLEYTKV